MSAEEMEGFTTIRNYITLKHGVVATLYQVCFTTIRNYITLKPQIAYLCSGVVRKRYRLHGGGAISDRVSSSKNLAQVPIDDEEFLRFHYIMTNPLQQEK